MLNRSTLRTATVAVAAVAAVRWIAQRVPALSFLRGVV